MKAQHINKLSKKTVFVYKNVKDQNSSFFVTDPTASVGAKTVLTSMNVLFNK